MSTSPASTAAARPAPGEYAPYYERYVSLVTGDVLETLERQGAETVLLLSALTEEQGDARYEPGKWSVKDLVVHMTDTERIFSYRLLRVARGDRTPIEGFDQDPYVANSNASGRSLASLAEEFGHVRAATLALARSLDDAAWSRSGVANESEISARALAYVIAGHEAHHVRILRERYL